MKGLLLALTLTLVTLAGGPDAHAQASGPLAGTWDYRLDGLRHFFIESDAPKDALVDVRTSCANLSRLLAGR